MAAVAAGAGTAATAKGGAHRARRREQRAALSTPAARLTRALTLKFGLREALGASGAAAVATHVAASVDAAGVVDFDRLFSSSSGGGGGGGSAHAGELKLEICSGLGEWIVAQAAADRAAKRGARWVALEIRHDRVWRTFVRSAMTFAAEAAATNLAIVAGDAAQVLPGHFAADSFSHVFVNHPEPPQQRGRQVRGDESTSDQRHLLTPLFLAAVQRVLQPGGMLVITTDNEWCVARAPTRAL